MNNNKVRIKNWLEEGVKKRSTHVIIAYNVNKKDFLPVYVGQNQNVRAKLNALNNDYVVKPVEVYDLSMDIEKQLLQARTWNA